MPDQDKKGKWDPKKLYQTPEFPEDEGTREVYDEGREKRGKWYVYALAAAGTLTVLLCILALTGAMKLPDIGSLFGSGSGLAGNVNPPAGMPVMSEIMPKGKDDGGEGKSYDWIEIYNPTNRAIDLAGYGLSDNSDKPGKFILPAYTLGGGECVVVYASGKESKNGEIHASFKLKASGTLLFTDPGGRQIQRINYPKMQENNSFKLDLKTLALWTATDKPTPGKPNP